MRRPFGSLYSLAAVGVFVLLAAASPPAGPPGQGAGAVVVQPITTLVFQDTFNSGSTYATYSGLGGATVSIAGGLLTVQVPAGAPPDSAGLRMRLPRNGTGVRCAHFDGLQIPPLGSGSMHWKLFGFDATTGVERVFLELFITEQPATALTTKEDHQLTFVYQKNGKNVYATIKTGKSGSDIKKVRWDTLNGGKRVQAEVTFKDGSTASSPWIDPDPGTISGFDVTTDAAEFSADETAGTEVHSDVAVQPAPVAQLDQAALNALEPHWLIQTHDADVVLAATVERVGRLLPPLGDDPRPRVLVHYFLDETLYGRPVAPRFAVAHAVGSPAALRQFQPGSRLLLFLQRETDRRSSRLLDFGDPAGVIRYSKQNRKAVATRVAFIHGGNVP